MKIVPRSDPPADPSTAPRDGSPHGRWRFLRRFGFAALLLLGGALALSRERGRESDLRDLRQRAERFGLDPEGLDDAGRRARREPDPADRRVAFASELLRRELLVRDPTSTASGLRLEGAREFAREALLAQPASHEAAMILGATVSLERSRARDPRLFSQARDWEAPLQAARELAPGGARPRQLLAAAYLEVWSALSPAKRETARELLREALRDPVVFDRLFEAWVAIAGSYEQASELLPDESPSWKRLAENARVGGKWRDFSSLTDRFRATLAREIDADLARAEAGTSLPVARWESLLTQTPFDDAFTARIDRVLALRPPGASTPAEARAAQAWFQWAAPLCLTTRCPLSGASMSRLASLAGGLLGSEQAAFAAIANGDLPRGELLERRTDSIWSEPWAPYLTLKATRLAAAGNAAGARQSLELVHRAFRARVAWRTAAAKAHAASSAMPPAAKELWEASDWWFDHGASRLDLVAAHSSGSLLLEPHDGLPQGALLEILWDGTRLPLLEIPARPAGAPAVRVALSQPVAAATAHLLEVRVLRGDLRPAMRIRLE